MMLTALIVAAVASVAPKYPASEVFLEQRDIIEKMNAVYPDVEVDVRWEPCEVENSYYSPGDETITLCTEFEAYPEVAVYVAAHEMAHAIQRQTIDTTSEQDADELAALALAKFDRLDVLLAGALYWKAQPNQGRTGEGHPSASFRAWELACIADGADGGTKRCVDLYQGLRVRWNERLSSRHQ